MRKPPVMTFSYFLLENLDLYFLCGYLGIYEIFSTVDTSVVLVPLVVLFVGRLQGIKGQLMAVQGDHGPWNSEYYTSLVCIEQKIDAVLGDRVKQRLLGGEPTGLASIELKVEEVMGELAHINRQLDKVREGK